MNEFQLLAEHNKVAVNCGVDHAVDCMNYLSSMGYRFATYDKYTVFTREDLLEQTNHYLDKKVLTFAIVGKYIEWCYRAWFEEYSKNEDENEDEDDNGYIVLDWDEFMDMIIDPDAIDIEGIECLL